MVPDADNFLPAAGPMVYGAHLMGRCLPPGDGIPQFANDKPPPIGNTWSSFSSGSLRALLSAHNRTSAASSSQGPTLPSQLVAMLRISPPAEEGQYVSSTLLPKNSQTKLPSLPTSTMMAERCLYSPVQTLMGFSPPTPFERTKSYL
jgi:hypothetical protein